MHTAGGKDGAVVCLESSTLAMCSSIGGREGEKFISDSHNT